MTAFPIALNAERVRAVVVGGGAVGTRKALALLEAGAQVRVVAREITAQLEIATAGNRLMVTLAPYASDVLADATVVIAATNSRELNSRVAADARERGKLVNVVDSPQDGDFNTMAIHRAGDLTIAVSTGGVPGAAARIRDVIAEQFDGRYSRALAALRDLRERLLASPGEKWERASATLIGDDFCDAVERETLPEKVAAWR